jgi:hypothetical protein
MRQPNRQPVMPNSARKPANNTPPPKQDSADGWTNHDSSNDFEDSSWLEIKPGVKVEGILEKAFTFPSKFTNRHGSNIAVAYNIRLNDGTLIAVPEKGPMKKIMRNLQLGSLVRIHFKDLVQTAYSPNGAWEIAIASKPGPNMTGETVLMQLHAIAAERTNHSARVAQHEETFNVHF